MSFRRASWDGYGSEPPFSITSEVDTGQKWTDGKAIYRRQSTGTFSTGSPINIDTSSWGIDQPVKLWLRIFRTVSSSEDQYVNHPGTTQPSVAGDMFTFTFRKSNILSSNASSLYNTRPWVLYAYYTKT